MKLGDVDLPAPLLARARAGDPVALEAFYRACARPAYALARRIVAGAAADDVVHDAFVDAIRGLPAFDGRAPLGAWFRRIVVRRCLMHLRSPWRRGREALTAWLEGEGPGDAGEASGAPREAAAVNPGPTLALRIDLDRALARLPGPTRLVVWLHDVEGWKHEEIAGAAGRRVSWSKSQLARGRARLRRCLDPEGATPAAPRSADPAAALAESPSPEEVDGCPRTTPT